METIIKKILDIATLAPSGDNAQPWKFSISENILNVFNIPKVDNSIYNYKERGSLISQGALLENVKIASSHFGYEAAIHLFPEGNNSDLIAKVTLNKSASPSTNSFDAIEKRCTNRKAYKLEDILPNHEQQLLLLPLEKPLVNFFLIKDRLKIKTLANTLNLNEIIFLENYHVHKGLFSFIRWTAEEEKKYGSGMYIKTLELAPPQEFAIKLFRHWPVINFFNKFHFATLVAKDSAKLYATSSAFGLITAPNLSEESLIATGRMMQRIWLSATNLGMSMQPTAGLLYLSQRVAEEGNELFSDKHVEMLKKAETQIKQTFNISSEVPTMLFRLGYSDPPTARSIKHSPVII